MYVNGTVKIIHAEMTQHMTNAAPVIQIIGAGANRKLPLDMPGSAA
jgi:hypothetical protein